MTINFMSARFVIALATIAVADDQQIGKATNAMMGKPDSIGHEKWRKLIDQGIDNGRKDDQKSAESSFKDAIDFANMSFEKGDRRTAISWFYLGASQLNQNKFNDSISSLEKSISLYKTSKIDDQIVFIDDHSIIDALECLAAAQHAQKLLNQSVTTWKQVVEYRMTEPGPESVNLAIALQSLATVQIAAKSYDDADVTVRKSLNISKHFQNREYFIIHCNSLNLYGCIMVAKGDLDFALVCWKKVVELQESLLGPDHIDISNTCNEISDLYFSKSLFGEAVHWRQRSLKIQENRWGDQSHVLLPNLEFLVEALKKSGQVEESSKTAERASRIRNRNGLTH